MAFYFHPNIVEVICHDKVETIERRAFNCYRSLRRVIMPGATIIEDGSFSECKALTDVECDKLEIIGKYAFSDCASLRTINLPSVNTVQIEVFFLCTALTNVKFGSKLERIERDAFDDCLSLQRITIPLKDGMIGDNIFQGCTNLKQLDLIEGDLHETITALHLEEWRNDMNEEIDSIDRILSNAPAGSWRRGEDGEKARVIRGWIRSVLRKIVHYEAERLLNEEIATTLQLALPRNILTNSVLPCLELPMHTFE